MNYLAIIPIPCLMLADYFLTIAGLVSRDSSPYPEHVVTPTYELNPMLRKNIEERRYFSPRHLVFTIGITAYLTLVCWISQDQKDLEWLFPAIIGALASMYLILIGRHLSNLAQFKFLRKHPESMQGRIEFSQLYSLSVSRDHTFSSLLLLCAAAIVAPTPFTIGMVFGPVLLMSTHQRWIRKHLKQQQLPPKFD